MINRSVRRRLLATTIVASAVIVSVPALAQTASGTSTNPSAAGDVSTSPSATAGDSTQQVGAATGPIEGQSGAAIASGPSSAETGPVDGGEIVVTGSRVPQPNLTSASPITVVNSEEIKLQGTTRVEDLLNSLPQVFADQGSTISNGASGIATVDLRGLGADRTLVLVNGRRLMPGDPESGSAADLNFIPDTLVKRVDVLTGGASTAYGSDAVSGVVNFIMDTDLDGVRVDGIYSLYQHTNSASSAVNSALTNSGFPDPGHSFVGSGNVNASIAFGTHFGDGRGHIVAYATYRHTDPITEANYDYSACSLSGTPDSYACGGSSTSATGRFILLGNGLGSPSYTVAANGFRKYVGATDAYNYAPTNYYQRTDERYTAGFFTDYEISKAVHPYAEFMFMDDKTSAQIAPSGDFGNTADISCDNPLLSAAEVAEFCQTANLDGTAARVNGAAADQAGVEILRRNVEGGPRSANFTHTQYRTVVGVKGDLDKGVSYDAYYQYGRVDYTQLYTGEFSATRLSRALNVTADPTTGAAVCESVLDGTDANCVPYNIFNYGGVTQAQLNYLSVPGEITGEDTEQVADASVTFDGSQYNIASPFATHGLGVNAGFEYRKETFAIDPDLEFQTGDLTGQGGATLAQNGAFDVKEGFVEASLPVVEDKPFVKLLSIDGGYRRSHYSIDGGGTFNTNAYKGEVIYAPVSDISFRGSYNRAVRAPNTSELFSTQNVVLDGATDPCSGSSPTATLEQCERQGVTAAQYGNILANSANQYNGLLGGNPNLQPEKSDSYTVGVVLTPTFLHGFALTVDAYRIKIANNITTLGADNILDACDSSGQYCNDIHRDPATGSLWLNKNGYVIDTDLNGAGLKEQGIDVNASYSRRIGSLGSVSASLVGTYLDKYDVTEVNVGTFNCANYFGTNCGTPNPRWRHKARITWTMPNGVGLSAQWRYFSRTHLDSSSPNTILNGMNADYKSADEPIRAESYFDLAATARVEDHLTLRVGVNNLLDRDAPIISSENLPGITGNGNTFPQVYDALGRNLFVGATIDF